MQTKPIYVTRPVLPPLEEFEVYLKDIWERKWLTNDGRYHQEFERALCKYLGVKYVSVFANGTLALIIALEALGITGEVLTTPFSFVATSHCLAWRRIKPVFVDVEPDYLTIDPEKIEAAITPRTRAIVPVHVYGNPCAVDKITKIARVRKLKVIYDACQGFGVKLNGNSILNFGDLSVLSFHATKVFTTFEGGAVICHDKNTKKKIDLLKNFGFDDEITVTGIGINAKMNEFQSSLGLLQLKYADKSISRNKTVAELYKKELKGIPGIRFLEDITGVRHNYNYFPVFVRQAQYGISRDRLYRKFRAHNILVRRYFYPLISRFPAYRGLSSAATGNLPVAERLAKEVLCLPIYQDLGKSAVKKICAIIKNC